MPKRCCTVSQFGRCTLLDLRPVTLCSTLLCCSCSSVGYVFCWPQGAELLQAAELAGSDDEEGSSDDGSVSELQLGSEGGSDTEEAECDKEEAAAATDGSGWESASEAGVSGDEGGSDAEGAV